MSWTGDTTQFGAVVVTPLQRKLDAETGVDRVTTQFGAVVVTPSLEEPRSGDWPWGDRLDLWSLSASRKSHTEIV